MVIVTQFITLTLSLESEGKRLRYGQHNQLILDDQCNEFEKLTPYCIWNKVKTKKWK
jgi:hypothetical protein